MTDLEQRRRTVRVLELLDESYRAHRADDAATADRAVQEAFETDCDVVVVLRGGMLIGEVPNPERDYLAWQDYVSAAQDALREAEAAEPQTLA